LKLLGYLNFLKEFFVKPKKSFLQIDIFIICADKDINNLKNCLKSIKYNIIHPISKIFIIGSNNSNLKKIAKNFNCVHINEHKLLEKSKLKIKYFYRGTDRSGWLYQQLLKIKACISLGFSEHKLVVDADTVFSRKQKFDKNDKLILNICENYHYPYFFSIKRLFGFKNKLQISFVTHHMLINKNYLIEMINFLEKKYNVDWIAAILNNISYNTQSNFSEYESYGHFLLWKYADKILLEYWFNKTMHKKDLPKFKNIFNTFFYKSLSFHSWTK
jgi:hypothetical protein